MRSSARRPTAFGKKQTGALFLGVELTSRSLRPHAMFMGLVAAAIMASEPDMNRDSMPVSSASVGG